MSLVSPAWLAAHRKDADVRVCDVRWFLPSTGRDGRGEYLAGHVPGAVFVDLDRDLASADDGSQGRHPLPSLEAFEAGMRRAGVSPGTHVVAYDDGSGAVAARLWWLLRANGHAKVSLLDGGLAGWKAAGLPVESGAVEAAPGDFRAQPLGGAWMDLAQTRAFLKENGLVLDARAPERYRGDTEPVDPRPGHVPGSVNLPVAKLLENGHFRSPEALHDLFVSLGAHVRPVAASCGSGVTACHLLFAMDLAGVRRFPEAKLYAGSYSEWSRHKELPVATGDLPGVPA